MCGIYGVTKQLEEKLISEKLESIRHRGPDFRSYRWCDKVWLGHARLSIIDLDDRSNQPFRYGPLQLVFNGEIYNFQEIREILKKKGYEFTTSSDTEVICASYLEWGVRFFEHLIGMFALVIFDSRSNQLVGGRDRFGQKPFYYLHDGTYFEFSSELRPILLDKKELKLDSRAVAEVLTRKYVVGEKSIVEEVKKILPGECFTFNLDNGKLEKSLYWKGNVLDNERFSGSYEEAKELVRDSLKKSVNYRMISDVPLGVFLSGGIDSSLIAKIAQESSSNKVKTFAVKFDAREFDESEYAQKVAERLGTDHTTIHCDMSNGLGYVKNFADYYDEPFADSSAIPSLILAKETRKSVTVALSGDAGDENFLGYQRYFAAYNRRRVFKIPQLLRQVMVAPLGLFSNHYRIASVSKTLRYKDVFDFYNQSMCFANKDWIVENDYFMDERLLQREKGLEDLFLNFSQYDFRIYIPDDINVKVDRSSMAYALEVRSPFLDHNVVNLSRSISSDFHLKDGKSKSILRSLLYETFDPSLFERPKSGFSVPLKHWFRGELKDHMVESFKTSNLESIPNLNVNFAQRALNDHLSQRADRSTLIWNIYVVQNWIETYKKHLALN